MLRPEISCYSAFTSHRERGFGVVAPERAPAAEAPNWMWTVFVVPPQGGWETEAGRSILTVLAWHEANITDNGKDIGSHDIHFVPMTETGEASDVRLPC